MRRKQNGVSCLFEEIKSGGRRENFFKVAALHFLFEKDDL